MNKKIFSLLLACQMIFGVCAFAEGEAEDGVIAPASQVIKLTIGEKELYVGDEVAIELDVPACIINDRTMVPLRAIFETLGATVYWDNDTKIVYGLSDDVTVAMQIGKNYMFVNSDRVELDSPSVIVEDRTLVPLRAIAEAYGCTVDYEDETKTVTITK